MQTSFWSPQRPDLNAKEAKIVSLLGFNVVGNLHEELRADFPEFRMPAASHDVPLGPDVDREDVRKAWEKLGSEQRRRVQHGAPFNFRMKFVAVRRSGKKKRRFNNFAPG